MANAALSSTAPSRGFSEGLAGRRDRAFDLRVGIGRAGGNRPSRLGGHDIRMDRRYPGSRDRLQKLCRARRAWSPDRNLCGFLGATSGNIAASSTKLWNHALIATAIAKGKSPDPVASTDQAPQNGRASHRQYSAEARLTFRDALICFGRFRQKICLGHHFHFSLGGKIQRFIEVLPAVLRAANHLDSLADQIHQRNGKRLCIPPS